jgi:alpha-tubulin suppressor-like RCC1 family protein
MGQLGDGSTQNGLAPSDVNQAAPYRSIELGASHGCAVREDERLACWGANELGQLGSASAGSCALAQGAAACATAPLLLPEGTNWKQVSAGSAFTCAIDEDDTLSCWGSAEASVLGVPEASGGITPAELGPAWSEVTAGLLHACGVRTTGALFCWGANGNAQLGLVGITGSEIPAETGFGLAWQRAFAGGFGTCALDTSEVLWCWGQGSFGKSATPAWVEFKGGAR